MDKFLLGVITGVVGIAVAAVISDRLDCSHQNISFNDEEPEPDTEPVSGPKGKTENSEESSKNEDTKKPESEEKRNPSILGEAIGMLLRDAK